MDLTGENTCENKIRLAVGKSMGNTVKIKKWDMEFHILMQSFTTRDISIIKFIFCPQKKWDHKTVY